MNQPAERQMPRNAIATIAVSLLVSQGTEMPSVALTGPFRRNSRPQATVIATPGQNGGHEENGSEHDSSHDLISQKEGEQQPEKSTTAVRIGTCTQR